MAKAQLRGAQGPNLKVKVGADAAHGAGVTVHGLGAQAIQVLLMLSVQVGKGLGLMPLGNSDMVKLLEG